MCEIAWGLFLILCALHVVMGGVWGCLLSSGTVPVWPALPPWPGLPSWLPAVTRPIEFRELSEDPTRTPVPPIRARPA